MQKCSTVQAESFWDALEQAWCQFDAGVTDCFVQQSCTTAQISVSYCKHGWTQLSIEVLCLSHSVVLAKD